MAIQAFVSQLSIEAFDEGILHRLARPDEIESDPVRGISEEAFSFLQLEAMMPHGSAWGLMQSISHVVETTPQQGISRHLHVCLAGRGEIRIGTNNRETFRGDASADIVMPPVATTRDQLKTMLSLSAEAVAAARC